MVPAEYDGVEAEAKVVPVHAMHVESVDALPAVQADPSAHSACVGTVQLAQAAPPVETVVPVPVVDLAQATALYAA